MANGLTAALAELIALKRFVRKARYKPEGKTIRMGTYLSRIRGRGMDFAEVRNYQAGDEIRHMEWRVTARTGRPHVKVYQEEKERPIVLLVDFNPSMYFGTRHAFKSVIAARLASLIAWTAVKQGDKVGALLYTHDTHHELMPRGRDKGILPLLSLLANYTEQLQLIDNPNALPLSSALQRLQRVTKPGSTIILISDFYQLDSACNQPLSRLRLNNNIIAYHVRDSLELAPPKPAVYAVTNGKQQLLLDTANQQVKQAYQHLCDNQWQTVKDTFKRWQIQHHQVTTEQDIPQLIHRSFSGSMNG